MVPKTCHFETDKLLFHADGNGVGMNLYLGDQVFVKWNCYERSDGFGSHVCPKPHTI